MTVKKYELITPFKMSLYKVKLDAKFHSESPCMMKQKMFTYSIELIYSKKVFDPYVIHHYLVQYKCHSNLKVFCNCSKCKYCPK